MKRLPKMESPSVSMWLDRPKSAVSSTGEWIKAIHEQPKIPFQQIYEHNSLSDDEIAA